MKHNFKQPQWKGQIRFFFTLTTLVLLSACSGTDKKTTTTTQSSGPGGGGPAKQPPMVVDYVIVKPVLISEKIEVPGNLMAYESTRNPP
jgi:hypothetical protein